MAMTSVSAGDLDQMRMGRPPRDALLSAAPARCRGRNDAKKIPRSARRSGVKGPALPRGSRAAPESRYGVVVVVLVVVAPVESVVVLVTLVSIGGGAVVSTGANVVSVVTSVVWPHAARPTKLTATAAAKSDFSMYFSRINPTPWSHDGDHTPPQAQTSGHGAGSQGWLQLVQDLVRASPSVASLRASAASSSRC